MPRRRKWLPPSNSFMKSSRKPTTALPGPRGFTGLTRQKVCSLRSKATKRLEKSTRSKSKD